MSFGDLEEHNGVWELRFTRTLPHPPERVWRALTEPDDLAVWFPTSIEGDRAGGAPLRFTFPNHKADPFDGRMLVCNPPHVLEFVWGTDRLRFELTGTDEGTLLTLTDVLDERGKAARDGAGWHDCLDGLEVRLDDASAPRQVGRRWQDVSAAYQERFGPEASTIGPPESVTRSST
jgi:uncharacterized protein YndB with AHSA1/START domain